jgi:hypothetical protein
VREEEAPLGEKLDMSDLLGVELGKALGVAEGAEEGATDGPALGIGPRCSRRRQSRNCRG